MKHDCQHLDAIIVAEMLLVTIESSCLLDNDIGTLGIFKFDFKDHDKGNGI